MNKHWNLSPHLLERFLRQRYLADFELETSDRPEVACNGPDTSWLIRYARRSQVDTNIKKNPCAIRDIPLALSGLYRRLVSHGNYLVLTNDERGVTVIDTTTAKCVATTQAWPTKDREITAVTMHGDRVFIGWRDSKIGMAALSDFTFRDIGPLHDDHGAVTAIETNGTWLITSCKDGNLRRYELEKLLAKDAQEPVPPVLFGKPEMFLTR